MHRQSDLKREDVAEVVKPLEQNRHLSLPIASLKVPIGQAKIGVVIMTILYHD